MEKKGLLARFPKSGDRRVTTITLTSIGDEVLSSTPDLLQQRLALKLKRIPADKLQIIDDSLDLLVEMLEIEDIDASPC